MKSKQLGLSPVGVLAICCLFALAVILALKLTTHYIDYYSLKGIYERMANNVEIKDADSSSIAAKLASRVRISGFRDVDVEAISYIGEDASGNLLLEFNYEVREHIIGNVDVILTFDYSSNPEASALLNDASEEE